MLTKVLVFESDPAFAGELRTEFGNLGCTTTVVEDGNVGLQQAIDDKPDLILLAIELPRMNGFSVCNKLKKDPSLKDVPLIIMSSESSDETFDQHKKLRTRAEDYIHKPIAFGELLQHVREFVQVGAPVTGPEGAIVIDDEIEIGSADYVLEDDTTADRPKAAAARPFTPLDAPNRGFEKIDDDVDAFAESAFGRLTGRGAQPASVESRPPQNGTMVAEGAAPSPRATMSPTALRSSSARPPPIGIDVLEHERIKGDLAVTRQRLDEAERQLDDSAREMSKLRLEAGDSARLMREIDDLRAKLAAASKGGGISSRDFLDLREALNKKDKDILALREQLSKKDREIVEASDRALGLERSRSDVEERLLAVERELAEARERCDAITSELDVARRTSDDFRLRLDKAKTDADARERQIAELRTKQIEERTATEAKLAAIRAEADQVVANERAEQARAIDQVEQRREAALEQAAEQHDAALAAAREQAERAREEALAAQSAQLRQEHEAAVVAVRRAHVLELERTRGEASAQHQAVLDSLRLRHEAELKLITDDRDARLSELGAEASRERGEMLDRIANVEAELAATQNELKMLGEVKHRNDDAYEAAIADLEKRAALADAGRRETAERLATALGRVNVLEGELEVTTREYGLTREKLAREEGVATRSRAKAESDRVFLERAKDALAVALAQIEQTEVAPVE